MDTPIKKIKKSHRINVRVSDEIKDDLDSIIKFKQVVDKVPLTLSDVVTVALEEYIDRYYRYS